MYPTCINEKKDHDSYSTICKIVLTLDTHKMYVTKCIIALIVGQAYARPGWFSNLKKAEDTVEIGSGVDSAEVDTTPLEIGWGSKI